MALASANANGWRRVRPERHLRLVPPLPAEPVSRSVSPAVGDPPVAPRFDDPPTPDFPVLWPVSEPGRSVPGPRRSPDRPDRSPGGWDIGEPDWSPGGGDVGEPD